MLCIAIISFVLIAKQENREIQYFPEQEWTVKEPLSFYWILVGLSLLSLILYKRVSNELTYQFVSFLVSVFGLSVLLFFIRNIIFKRRLSLDSIGFKRSYVYWFIALISAQYSILLGFFVIKTNKEFFLFVWPLIYYSVVLIIWPLVEELLYRGLIFIPTSRKIGLLTGAILVSFLQAISHFNHSPTKIIMNFTIFGIFNCYLYVRTRGILVPLLLHSSFNFVVLVRNLELFSV